MEFLGVRLTLFWGLGGWSWGTGFEGDVGWRVFEGLKFRFRGGPAPVGLSAWCRSARREREIKCVCDIYIYMCVFVYIYIYIYVYIYVCVCERESECV